MVVKVALLYLVALATCVTSVFAESYESPLPVQAYQPPQLYKTRTGLKPDIYEEPPKPFNFGHQIQDDDGNIHQREESGDEYGNVHGSYGYTDALGLYRRVQYIADAEGFRATVESNEPGVTNDNPANVEITAEESPAQIKDSYSAPGFTGYGARGYKVPHRYLGPEPVIPTHVALPHPAHYGVNSASSPVRPVNLAGHIVSPHGAVSSNRVGVSPFTGTNYHAPPALSPHY
ncbi:cuticle protein 16.8-like [Limulus polyphemus]|uniref:Cuticle protein 16.8-like n=1 Tax=Limulus polyphemus TaxID=6850 RepID=A0ABM1C4M3_LIMPO|nr:cuticle protein 16.8-like [Limulus polyphemus]